MGAELDELQRLQTAISAATGELEQLRSDLRRAARAAIAAGCPLRVAAEAAGVSHQTIANWAAAAD